MRQEKFDNSKSSWESDDIKYAFECNNLSQHLENIDVIVAEVCGANDEDDWHWILQMKDGTFRYATGGCDYTGWDCQSHASISDPCATVEDALSLAPEDEEYGRKHIRQTLKHQIDGEVPFAIYNH